MSKLVRRSSIVLTTVQLISVQSMPTSFFFSAPMLEHHFSPGQNADMSSDYIRHSGVQHALHQDQETDLNIPSNENIVHAARHHHARRSVLSKMSQGFDTLENKSRKARSVQSDFMAEGEVEANEGTETKDEAKPVHIYDFYFQDASKFFGMGSW